MKTHQNKMLVLLFVLGLGIFAVQNVHAQEKNKFDPSGTIHALTREDGSGTRQAFADLFDLKDENGIDQTDPHIAVTNATSVMMMTAASDPNAIGFTSLGAMNDQVRPVAIDNVEASQETIENGTYSMARPFQLAITKDLSPAGQDFIRFILSPQGERVIADQGYIPTGNSQPYEPAHIKAEIMVSGSSSVAPVMEKLKEQYETLSPETTVIVQQSDSSSGMRDAIDGTADIGMASRQLERSELDQGLQAVQIAKDGIVVIVNPVNPVRSLSAKQVKAIFTDSTLHWNDIEAIQ